MDNIILETLKGLVKKAYNNSYGTYTNEIIKNAVDNLITNPNNLEEIEENKKEAIKIYRNDLKKYIFKGCK